MRRMAVPGGVRSTCWDTYTQPPHTVGMQEQAIGMPAGAEREKEAAVQICWKGGFAAVAAGMAGMLSPGERAAPILSGCWLQACCGPFSETWSKERADLSGWQTGAGEGSGR